MAQVFQLSVVTAESTVFDGNVEAVNLPTPFGSVGILARHAPILCAVGEGIVRCTVESGERIRIQVSEGVASVADNEVTLLVSDARLLTE